MMIRLRNVVVERVQASPRRLRMKRQGVPFGEETFSLVSTAGYRIETKIFRPVGDGPHPAVLLVPGTNDGHKVFEGWSQPINAKEVASMGWIVMTFDPAGRGESWGEENYGGLEHQDNVRIALRHLAVQADVDQNRLGVLSISLGLCMACGALANWSENPAKWLLDWEGPSDREIITSGGRILTPALGHSLRDDTYWFPREAQRNVEGLSCGYWRLQAQPDHAQGEDVRHAERMMAAASASSLPWFQINRHPRGMLPKKTIYLQGGRLPGNRMILEALGRLGAFSQVGKST